jgi:hypothetical protein
LPCVIGGALIQLKKFLLSYRCGTPLPIRWDFFIYTNMESISYGNFDIEPSGKVFNLNTKTYVTGKKDRHNEIRLKFEGSTELIKSVMSRLFFDFDINFQSLIRIWHIDQNNNNIDLYNIKIYPKEDKYNKSGVYIAFNSNDEICTFNRKGQIQVFENMRDAYVSIILNE